MSADDAVGQGARGGESHEHVDDGHGRDGDVDGSGQVPAVVGDVVVVVGEELKPFKGHEDEGGRCDGSSPALLEDRERLGGVHRQEPRPGHDDEDGNLGVDQDVLGDSRLPDAHEIEACQSGDDGDPQESPPRTAEGSACHWIRMIRPPLLPRSVSK